VRGREFVGAKRQFNPARKHECVVVAPNCF